MYDDSDLDAAVAAGTIAPTQAQDLRRFVAARHAAPAPVWRDAQFRYRAGDRDLLPAAGIGLLLIGVAWMAAPILGAWTGAPVAGVAWLLSRNFARRRAGIATTVLFLAFALGVATALTNLALGEGAVPGVTSAPGGLVVAGGCVLASWLYWRSFRLPIAVAAITLSALTIGDHLLMMLVPSPHASFVTAWMLLVAVLVLLAGIWWDASDVYRQTVRSDVAFWLHGLAGFKLAASGFRAVYGVRPGVEGWQTLWSPPPDAIDPTTAVAALALFACYALLALVLDRRAVLLMSLVFVVSGARALAGVLAGGVALAAMGAVLVALVLYWPALRRAVLNRLPATLRAQVPRSDPEFWYERPVV